jgi:carbon starvation protein
MEALLIALGAGLIFFFAYHSHGRWLTRSVFRLDAATPCPSQRFNDGRDYVPTRRGIVFGHHFASIAGTGPIVGPAIAVIWGWGPALLWIVLGSIFIGAVHDLGSLAVSLRSNGQTIGDVAGRVINARTRLLFLSVLFLALTIVIAIFGLVIAAVFRQYPASIFPCLVQIPLAVGIGLHLHRKGRKLALPSLVVLALMYLLVAFGDFNFGFSLFGWAPGQWGLGAFNQWLAGLPVIVWVIGLLAYAYVASVIPVWALLQPRDYVNALQLISALALVVVGLTVAAILGGAPLVNEGVRPTLELSAPLVRWNPAGAPLLLPFLFITIACGAVSGFHCLVSSGTSSKQISRETDAQLVGYGAMLLEAFLAVVVVLACVAGLGLGVEGSHGEMLTGSAAWAARYGSWGAAGGLAATVGAFVDGSANFLKALGLPSSFAVPLMGVFVASFAATTLDSATRLQRYVVQELAGALFGSVGAASRPAWIAVPARWLRGRHQASLFAVVVAGSLAAMPSPSAAAWTWHTAGTGGLILWPIFGATNQLMGGLAFLVVAFWLWRRGQNVWFIVIPLVFMLVVPLWAMAWQVFVQAPGRETGWWQDGNWLLVGVAVATIALEVWMVAEACCLYRRLRRIRGAPQTGWESPSGIWSLEESPPPSD